MLKRIRSVLFPLLLLSAIVVATSYWWLDSVARHAIEVEGADAMGATVELDRIDVGILRGRVEFAGLNVANPAGYEKPYFFHVDGGTADVGIATVLRDVIEVPTLVIQGLTMYLEQDEEGEYNYERILDNIERYSRSGDDGIDGQTLLRIDRLEIRDVKVYYKIGQTFVTAPSHVDEIVLRDVGSDGSGVTYGQLMTIILTGTLKGVAVDLPGAIGRGILDGIKKLGKVGEMTIERITDAAKEGIEKILGDD